MMRDTERHAQRGGALVEFAVVAPVALILLFGIIQFGELMFAYHATDYAARSAARWASVRGAGCSNSTDKVGSYNVCPSTTNSLQTFVQTTVPGATNATVTVHWTTPSSASYPASNPTGACNDTPTESQGCLVSVTVNNSYTLDIPFMPQLGKINMSSTAASIVQN